MLRCLATRHRLVPVAVLGAMFASPPAQPQSHPAALENAQRYRESLRTGKVDFVWSPTKRYTDTPPHPRVYTVRCAEEGDVVTFRGDEAGLAYTDGGVDRFWRGFRSTLKTNGETWVYGGDGLTCMLSEPAAPRAEGIWPLRALGLSYRKSSDDPADTIWRDKVAQAGARTYRETIEDGLHVVAADTDAGTITWYIDPQRGWNPVRVTLARDGAVVEESRTTLRQWDNGVWFPAEIAFFGADASQPLESVVVTSAEFNRPEHPRVLTPAEIGIEAGMNVEVSSAGGGSTLMRFDGEKAVSMKEFGERHRAGEIRYGPTFQRELARLEMNAIVKDMSSAPTGGPNDNAPTTQPRHQSEWEAYTREFIRRYELNADQTQRAMQILRDCQDQANNYLLRKRVSFERLRDRAAKAAEQPTEGQRATMAEIAQEHARLRGPIQEIFDQQLKPRLKKLPTRAQRQAAGDDAAATSAPSRG